MCGGLVVIAHVVLRKGMRRMQRLGACHLKQPLKLIVMKGPWGGSLACSALNLILTSQPNVPKLEPSAVKKSTLTS